MCIRDRATDYWGRFRRFEYQPGRSINDAVTHTCCQTAMDLEADAILTPTQTGHTARMKMCIRDSSSASSGAA